MTYDVAVVGAGAAGLMAAIFAGRGGARVVVVDGARKIGAKILISGGGRCNVTHDVVTAEDFNGNRNTIGRVLRTFTVAETIAFFEEIGVALKREDTGKLFPVTDRASTVLNALLRATRDAGADIISGTRVNAIRTGASFALETSGAPLEASRVVLATGGQSVPKTGSDGHGFTIAHSLGHTVTETFPALVPLVIDEPHWIRDLTGTSAEVELSVRSGSRRVLIRQRGAMLMTHFGVSGPVVLDISRHWIAARKDDRAAALVASFLPGDTSEDLEKRLVAAARRNPHGTVGSALRGLVPERILSTLAPPTPLGRLEREERRRIALSLTELPIPVSRDRGFEYAEVTAGGVPLSEIESATMASRRCRGLYLCGEILDVDGRIGGFNFQWAWNSGRLAGLNCANLA
ncbi:MAG TPA: aminoacetone oxidase family FAD-binding enzyme [Thermoanaerobaculia bacterium]|nr:aminoacetone oxidase family FAD-binding enzyme [Thermoanaerobaculia bacterium]